MPKRSSKQKDPAELARHVLDTVVPDAEPAKEPTQPKPEKNPAAVALGRLAWIPTGPFQINKKPS